MPSRRCTTKNRELAVISTASGVFWYIRPYPMPNPGSGIKDKSIIWFGQGLDHCCRKGGGQASVPFSGHPIFRTSGLPSLAPFAHATETYGKDGGPVRSFVGPFYGAFPLFRDLGKVGRPGYRLTVTSKCWARSAPVSGQWKAEGPVCFPEHKP